MPRKPALGPSSLELEIRCHRAVDAGRHRANVDWRRCEFAIVVSDDWRRMGRGSRLMQAPMSAARASGMRIGNGDVMAAAV